MADALRVFAPLAHDARARQSLEPVRRADDPPARRTPSRPGCSAIVEALAASTQPFVFPVHPRTRRVLDNERIDLPANVRAIEPLGFLEMLALTARAETVVTDSGGLQKEAYWLRVPCVTLRPSTEWVDTVAAGANLLAEPGELRGRGRRSLVSGGCAAALRRRSRRRAHRSSPVRLTAVPESNLYDVAVIGAGYVGVPLAATFGEAGQRVLLVDVQRSLVDALNRGESHIEDVSSERLEELVRTGRVVATTDYEQVKQAHAVLIALPTPLSRQREPDLSLRRERARRASRRVLQRGQVVVLESTTWPGTTREIVQPILEQGSGLTAGEDFHLAMSPERVDPGREDWTTKTTPKVVGGINAASTAAAAEVYRRALDTVHEVSTPDAAELTKLLENIYRAVNIALVNELAQLCDRMNIDVWEVIEAAATKPFGFASFKPGPGLGGHCIPIDPFYLTWKAREFDFSTRFIELAGEVNNNMPYFCRSLISQALNHGARKSVSGAKILILGVAYKPDIGDYRETPAEKLIHLLRTAGADVSYHDPYVPEFAGMTSAPLEPEAYDCVAIVTNHSSIDYAELVQRGKVIVDFRNATKGHEIDGKVWKL